jgi:integrase
MNEDTGLRRPVIKPPLNKKKIETILRCVAADGKVWNARDGKRLRFLAKPSSYSGATASWLWRRQFEGWSRDLGLGSWPETSIEEARELALDAERQFRATGVHPIDARKQAKSSAAVAKTTQITFGQAAADFYRQTAPSWRSVKTAIAWRTTILGVTPTGAPSAADWCRRLRPILISDITTPMVVAALEERWGTATGPRVARAISSVFAWALARQLRQPPNPADWTVLSKALASTKSTQPRNFAAMAWRDMPTFFAKLRNRTDIAAQALAFLILCASRTKEIRLAAWSEISDLEGTTPVWTIPGSRMKGGKEHRVPLSRAAAALLKAIPHEPGNPLIFVSSRPGQPMAHDSMLRVLADMDHVGITAHGFRSGFSDYAHECTAADPLIIEACLAHAAGGKVEKAYRRGDLLSKRRALMEAWAGYLTGETSAANVTPLHPLHGEGAR